MSEERFTPLDAVELAHSMTGIASAVWSFFNGLREEGFTEDQAMKITTAWVRGIASPRGSQGDT